MSRKSACPCTKSLGSCLQDPALLNPKLSPKLHPKLSDFAEERMGAGTESLESCLLGPGPPATLRPLRRARRSTAPASPGAAGDRRHPSSACCPSSLTPRRQLPTRDLRVLFRADNYQAPVCAGPLERSWPLNATTSTFNCCQLRRAPVCTGSTNQITTRELNV